MLVIIGLAVVLGSVGFGFFLEHGNFHMLFQPAELVIIGGACAGALITATPMKTIKLLINGFKEMFGAHSSKESYLELFSLLNRIFIKIKRDGLISIEGDIENPTESLIFREYGHILANKLLLLFICDNLRVIMTATNMPAHQLESLLEVDIEVVQHDTVAPSMAMASIADACPGLGIVAAVLGVIITMGVIDQPPTVIGHHIAAALVGTMIGVLSCYGILGPIAANLGHIAIGKSVFFNVVKIALVSYVSGMAPLIALEAGRRVIPTEERPTFVELDQVMREGPK
ncbi:flagellar motor stator protein MotA [bacterium]|nr:flagellar motor stator protein MotA [bacterium]